MPYTVVWIPEAETELTRLYLKARERGLTELWVSCAHVDRVLRHAPDQVGVPMEDFPGLWAYAAPPLRGHRLAVVYRIAAEDLQVLIQKPYVLPSLD
jgi:hypothetical protein